MKFQQIIQAVYSQPWSITRDGWSSVHAIVKGRLEDPERALPKAEEDAETDFFGNEMPKMEVTDDGVAIVPIFGTLIQHGSLIEKMCGACSYDDIKRDLDAAVGVRALQKIVLNINSPGGMCMGCQEIASKIGRIRDSGIRIEAITDTQMCSAAYNLAAGCNRISCTPSAMVGSIGVMSALLDESLKYEMQGLKREMFVSGALKGAGCPGTTFSEEQRAYFQGLVDHYAKMFTDHVRRYRVVEDESMQGQAFIGQGAADAGLVDVLVDDLDGCLCVDRESYLDSE